VKRLGSQTVAGQDCAVYAARHSWLGSWVEYRVLVSTDLGIVMKSGIEGADRKVPPRIPIDHRAIQRSLADSLFAVPAGVQIMDMASWADSQADACKKKRPPSMGGLFRCHSRVHDGRLRFRRAPDSSLPAEDLKSEAMSFPWILWTWCRARSSLCDSSLPAVKGSAMRANLTTRSKILKPLRGLTGCHLVLDELHDLRWRVRLSQSTTKMPFSLRRP
jgi:hypothetical protein